jgi:hypothetical protein
VLAQLWRAAGWGVPSREEAKTWVERALKEGDKRKGHLGDQRYEWTDWPMSPSIRFRVVTDGTRVVQLVPALDCGSTHTFLPSTVRQTERHCIAWGAWRSISGGILHRTAIWLQNGWGAEQRGPWTIRIAGLAYQVKVDPTPVNGGSGTAESMPLFAQAARFTREIPLEEQAHYAVRGRVEGVEEESNRVTGQILWKITLSGNDQWRLTIVTHPSLVEGRIRPGVWVVAECRLQGDMVD